MARTVAACAACPCAPSPPVLCRSQLRAPARLQWLQAMASSHEAAGPAASPAQAAVAVVTTLGCPYCKKAKAALQVRWGRASHSMRWQPARAH